MKIKYEWYVDYVYDGQNESMIGNHNIRIKISPVLDCYSEEVEKNYEKYGRRVLAYYQKKGDNFSTPYIQKVNHLVISDLKKNSDDKKIVEEVMKLFPLIKEDKKLRGKRKLIKEIKSRKGRGEIK